MNQAEAEALSGYQFTPGWEFHDIKREGQLSGFVMTKDNEVHVFRLPAFNGRWFVRGDIDRVLEPLVRQFGCVVTKVMNQNKAGRRFCKRIGFVETSVDGDVVNMKLERWNHARH